MCMAFCKSGCAFGHAAHYLFALCDHTIHAGLNRGFCRSSGLLTGSSCSCPGSLRCGWRLLLVCLALFGLGNGVGASFTGFVRWLLSGGSLLLCGFAIQLFLPLFQLLRISRVRNSSGQLRSLFDLVGTLDTHIVVLVLLDLAMDRRQE